MSTSTPPGASRTRIPNQPGPESSGLRLGHVAGDATGGWAVEWHLKRNCSLAPRQLFGCYGVLCVLSLTVATFFWWFGARAVMPYAGVELSAVGLALLVYARHATDNESIA